MSAPAQPLGRQIARNTLLNIAAQILPLAVAVLTIPPLVSGLGEARFGLLALSWVILGYFGVFDLGMGRAATRFVADALGRGEDDSIPGLVWTAVGIQSIFSVVGATTLALLTPLLAGRVFNIPAELSADAVATLYLLAVGIPFVLVASSFRGVLEAAQRFDLVNAVRIPATSLNYLLALAGVALGYSLPAIIALLVGSRALVMLAYALLCFRIFPDLLRAPRMDRTSVRRLTSFGGWIMLSALTIPILTYAEQFLIVSLLSVGALTFYSAPFEMISRTAIVPAALALTLFPAFSYVQARSRDRIGELSWRPLKHLLAAVLPTGVVLAVFAPDILHFWLGGDFAGRSTAVLQILVVAFSINALATIPFAAVQGLGRPDLKARLDLVEVPLFITLAWLLIPHYGIAGAALAKLVVAAFDTVMLFIFAAKLGALSPVRTASRGVPAVAAAGMVYVAASVMLAYAAGPSLALRVTLVALATAAFLAVYLRFGVDDTDSALVHSFLRARRAPPAIVGP
jgi:O-antigen/teichoic acid export membrane protein